MSDMEWIDELLNGIDQDETENKNGWWETSVGAEFGAKKKAELKAVIRQHIIAEKRALLEGLKTQADNLHLGEIEFNPHEYNSVLKYLPLSAIDAALDGLKGE